MIINEPLLSLDTCKRYHSLTTYCVDLIGGSSLAESIFMAA